MQELEATIAVDDTTAFEASEVRQKYLRLTGRERDVLQMVAAGFTAPEIGRKLSISPKTVDTYKQRINEKMSLSHRSEYVTLALRLGLFS